MTPEQIEGWRVELERAYGRQAASLCDLALKGLQVEAMREAIRRAVEHLSRRDLTQAPLLKGILADLQRALNERKET
jgi:hypothetical protein